MDVADPGGPDVSVVVATFRTGAPLLDLVDSLARQTIGTDRLELVTVDDGSGDDTPDVLRALAADRPWMTVAEIPNSGWPCRPRNVGTDLARGRWVLYMDHDDRLWSQALEAMVSAGDRAGADVVIGKEVRTGGRTIGLEAFRSSTDDAHVTRDHAFEVLTPHRMYRHAFLDEHGVRFEESLRRLEDVHLLAAAEVHAPTTAVVADLACYQWVIHGENSSLRHPDPVEYFDAARRVLDEVDRWPHPEEVRDDARRVLLRALVLNRASPSGLPAWDEEYRRAFFAEARRLTRERLPASLDAGLGAHDRLRAALVRRGDLDLLVALGTPRRIPTTRPHVAAVEAADGRLRVTVTVRLLQGDGADLVLRRRGDRLLLRPDPLVPDDLATVLDVAAEFDAARVDLLLVERSTNAEWFQPAEVGTRLVEGPDGPVWEATLVADVDPATARAGHPVVPGRWDLRLHTHLAGIDSRVLVRLDEDLALPAPLRQGPMTTAAYRTAGGRMALHVTRTRPPGPSRSRRARVRLLAGRVRRRLRLRLR
ncbi:glycosyltransferase [Phycicoccus sp. HDW14]|uniref:glycosyltransferase family 2 protein n=1 Tax=Phycicoccus sp. HDW14 TaxID=2714941 RepID=UPI001409870F|nr:glycosyltransferase [Phycicoccus sp. HDW14]QIM19920.1 glycosyltransferase [Phycicoccus sp. HDW14]